MSITNQDFITTTQQTTHPTTTRTTMTDPRQDNTDEPEETNIYIWGQPPTVNPDIITILYQNVNGFHGIDTQLRLIEENIRPDIIGIVELNIPLTGKNREMIREQMNNVFDASVISCAHTKDPTPSVRYKPGGTMVAALNQLVGHVIGKGRDELGRWSYITLAGTNGKRLTIMSAYRVHNNPKAGPMTYYSQLIREHERMRQSEAEDTAILEPIDPSAETVKALRLQLQEFQSHGHDLVILLDANEYQTSRPSLDGDNKSILHMLDSLSLVPTYTTITDDPDELPNTHINGSKCIDFIYVSESIIPFITTVSILPFGEGFHSDHRALVMQLDPTILYDHRRQDLTKPSQRLIRTNEVKRCEKYIKCLLKMVEQHQIGERLDNLITNLKDRGPTDVLISKFNHLDREFGEYIRAAEKQANKGITKWDWSPPLTRARLRYRYWKMRRQLQPHNLSITNKWRRLVLTTDIGNSYAHDHFNISEIDLEIKNALIDLKAVKKNHISLREQHLRDLAFKYAKGNQKDEERIVKRIRYMEEQKRIFTKITNIFKGPKEPLTAILAPSHDYDTNNLILTTKQQTIFEVLTTVNQGKLRASINSPFLSGNMAILGETGFTNEANMILHGQYPTFDLTTVQQVFIEELSNQLRPIPETFLNEGEFQDMILNTRETTSSSPSGRHYGLYRAGVQNDDLLHIHAGLAIQPFRYGFVLDRWRHIIQVMLKKKPQPIYNSLRIIEIFEGDFSAISKIIMKNIMNHLERENDTVAGTYATIRGGSTHQAIFSRVWAYDMARVQRSAIATIDNDSIGAYDRIIPQLLSILLRRMGCSDNLTKTLITQLTMKSRRIQTAYGLSDPIEIISPEGNMEYLGGIGQGHPGGPTAYHALLLPMIRVLQRLTEGYEVRDPNGKKYRQVITSYVDDCNQLVTVPRYKDKRHLARQLIKTAQHTLNIWDEVIQLSGGAISIDKSFWTICPGWYEYRGKLLPITVESLLPDEDVNIYSQGQIYPMRDATTSERYLGVRVGITGSMADEWDYRMKQSIAFSEVVKTIASRKEAVVAYRSYYRPKFEYPLPVTTMSKTQLDSIERPSITALLSTMGYNRNFPRAVVFGPVQYGGIGLKSLYSQQGYLGIKWFIKTVREESRVTELLRTLVFTTQLEAGIGTHILSSSVHRKRILQYLTPTWLTHIITFLEEHGLNLLLDNQWGWLPNLQRQEDAYLMDIFLRKTPYYTVSELRSINRVRIFLQAYSRSCITDNQSISSHLRTAKHCRSPRVFRQSTLEWPEVQTTAADWTVWRKALKYLESTEKTPMGYWIYTHQRLRPVNIETRFILLRTRPRNIQEALYALPFYQRHALGVTWAYEDNINQFLEEFQGDGDLSLIGGSDGGYREAEDQAAHAFTVRTANEDILFEGAGPTDGYPMSSYRTELMGLFSVMVSLDAIRQLFPVRRKRVIPIEVFCDNQSSVNMINNSEEYLDPLVEEYDVISEICSLKKRLSTWYSITVTWIKGHQSQDTGTGDPRGISINNDMNRRADYI